MKNETKHIIAKELFKIIQCFKVGFFLAIIPFVIAICMYYYWIGEIRFGITVKFPDIDSENLFYLSGILFVLPLIFYYLYRLYKWILKWK